MPPPDHGLLIRTCHTSRPLPRGRRCTPTTAVCTRRSSTLGSCQRSPRSSCSLCPRSSASGTRIRTQQTTRAHTDHTRHGHRSRVGQPPRRHRAAHVGACLIAAPARRRFKTEWSALILAFVLGVTNMYMYPFWSVDSRLTDFYRYYFFQVPERWSNRSSYHRRPAPTPAMLTE